MIWEIRDKLEGHLSKGELKDLLGANGQAIPKGESCVCLPLQLYYTYCLQCISSSLLYLLLTVYLFIFCLLILYLSS